jgi:uracil-DNA glycosylase family 4
MNFEEHDAEIIACRKCPRLVEWREEVARTKRRAYRDWDYWGKPVPGFGDPKARVMIVGLAPGAHGSNRTGRMFTGDASGNFLFDALYRAGFASQPEATTRDDDLTLSDLFITAVARCVPPGNKPSRLELENCQPYLERELEMIQPQVLVPLGRIAFERLRRIYSIPASALDFAHGAIYRMENGPWLVCSYHPSQQNTQTGRLTREMFDQIWAKVKSILK